MYTELCNHQEPSTITYNHPQSPKTNHNHPKPSTTTCNVQQLHTTTHNYLKSSITTQKYPKITPKKPRTCLEKLCYCTLDVKTETDVDFVNDMKQYMYMCVYMCLCIYFIIHLFTFIVLSAFRVIHLMLRAMIFCLLKIWNYELLKWT